jgi:hypothetical protein
MPFKGEEEEEEIENKIKYRKICKISSSERIRAQTHTHM